MKEESRKRIGWLGATIGAASSLAGLIAAGVICGPVCIAGPFIAVLGIGVVAFLYRYSIIFVGLGAILFITGTFLVIYRRKAGFNCSFPLAVPAACAAGGKEVIGMTEHKSSAKTNIVIINGSCCIPGMAPFDEQAGKVVRQAVAETGIDAEVMAIPATTAFMGGAPKEIIARLMTEYNQSGRIGLPAVIINGKLAFSGVPKIEEIKSILLKIREEKYKKSNLSGAG